MNLLPLLALAGLFTLGVTGEASAYVGPGAGLSVLGALWGLIIAVGAAVGFVVLWPLRRMFKRGRAPRTAAGTTTAGTTATADDAAASRPRSA